MKKYDLGDKPRGPAVLFVNAAWCGHCTATKPEVRKLSRVLGSEIPVYDVDGDANAALVDKWKVEGFPTFFYVGPTGRRSRYAGADRTAAALADWACAKAGTCARK